MIMLLCKYVDNHSFLGNIYMQYINTDLNINIIHNHIDSEYDIAHELCMDYQHNYRWYQRQCWETMQYIYWAVRPLTTNTLITSSKVILFHDIVGYNYLNSLLNTHLTFTCAGIKVNIIYIYICMCMKLVAQANHDKCIQVSTITWHYRL